MFTHPPERYPTSALPQLYSDLTHAGVIIIVVLCAAVLCALHVLDTSTVGNVFTAAIGYAAGRAGSVAHRQLATRHSDGSDSGQMVDASS